MSHEDKRQRDRNDGDDFLTRMRKGAVTLTKHRLDGGMVGGGELPDATRQQFPAVGAERTPPAADTDGVGLVKAAIKATASFSRHCSLFEHRLVRAHERGGEPSGLDFDEAFGETRTQSLAADSWARIIRDVSESILRLRQRRDAASAALKNVPSRLTDDETKPLLKRWSCKAQRGIVRSLSWMLGESDDIRGDVHTVLTCVQMPQGSQLWT